MSLTNEPVAMTLLVMVIHNKAKMQMNIIEGWYGKRALIGLMGQNEFFADLNTTKLDFHSDNLVYPISLV